MTRAHFKLAAEEVAFTLSNRIPRKLATRWMAWFSRIEQPLVRDLSLAVWRGTADLRLHEAKAARFRSVHDCFVRELKAGARPIAANPGVIASPCDAIVGATGHVTRGQALQVKGSAYPLRELLADDALALSCEGGMYVTLRITPSMYHRFHAPYACTVSDVTWLPGDTFNVNPPALARVPRLFCRNERAVLRLGLEGRADQLVLVPVAAILVASLRLHCLDATLHSRSVAGVGPSRFSCEASYRKGEEMGWFEHGSTIVLLAPPGVQVAPGIATGRIVRMGEALLTLPED